MAILKNPDIAIMDEDELGDMDLAFYLDVAWMAKRIMTY
jgi:hypothetical protein